MDAESLSALRTFIDKLAHHLEEIRVRSLNTILLKLQCGIIKDDDLIREKQILSNLLEWFNFSSVSQHEDVLNLLLRLSKNPIALDHLNSIGAVKFFSDLRETQDEQLQKLIDKLLESLFLLPDIDPEHVQIEICPVDHKSQDKADSLDNKNGTIISENVQTVINRPSDEHRHLDTISSQSNEGREYSGFKLLSLKWIDVSATDMRILTSTNESLQSTDPQSVSKSCSFLNDVLFRDFPSEIFLQHSQIVKSLLQLFNYSSTNLSHLPLKAVNCLLSLTKLLIVQINCCRDAVLYNLKPIQVAGLTPEEASSQSTESLESRPSVIGQSNVRYQGDGQDGDTSTNNVPTSNNRRDSVPRNNPDTVAPVFTSRHSDEISIPQYCMLVFVNSSSLLQSSNPQVLTTVLELLTINCDLLNMAIDPCIWNDPSSVAEDMKQKLFTCYDSLACALMEHYEKCVDSRITQSTNVKIHRVSVLCIASVLARLLEISLPNQEICHIHIPESCLSIFPLFIMDFLFENSQPELHSLFLKLSRSFKQNGFLSYQSAAKISKALKCAIQCNNMIIEESNLKETFALSLDALQCLHYFYYWEFVDSFILKFSKVCAQDIFDCDTVRLGSLVLQKLLAYPEPEVRKKAYEQCLRLVKDSIGLNQIANVSSMNSERVKFLLDSKILEQIIYFGLEDSVDNIASMSREVLLTFLQSLMLMNPEIRNIFMDLLEPVLPVLQAYMDTETPFGIALFHLIDTDNSHWSSLIVLKANIRLLFSKDKRLRGQAIPRIAWYIAKEDNSIYKHPSLSQFDATTLANIFVNIEELAVADRVLENPYSHNLGKLLEIFESAEVGLGMRKAAGQQLAFLINDSSLFQQFKHITTYNNLFHILEICLTSDIPAARNPPNTVELIPVIIEIIFTCLMKDTSLVLLLDLNDCVYYSLLRSLLILKLDNPTIRRIQIILACLLFHDCCDVRGENSGVVISIPLPTLIEKFNLPCAEKGIQHTNINVLDLPSIRFDNAQTMNLFRTYLKFSWNAAFADGWAKLIALDPIPDLERFSFTDEEKHLIKTTQELLDPVSYFQEIVKATSHKPVLINIAVLSWQLFTVCMRNNEIPVKSDVLQMTFSRFLSTPPISNADKTLLKSILQFFNLILNWSRPLREDIMEWMYGMVSLQNGALLSFLENPGELCSSKTDVDDPSSYSPLLKELLTFMIILLSRTPYQRFFDSSSVKKASASMIHFILKHMNLAEAPQYYNLASLEAVLQCLVHITAIPGFSHRTSNGTGLDTCRQLTALLMEVVAAFHLYRDGTNHTFMGRGITLSATICLNHVASEMHLIDQNIGWINDWLYNVQDEADTQHGLGWLIPLWTHSDPQVRAASLSTIVCLTDSKPGCGRVMSQIQQVAQGLPGVALSFLLDHFEASIVREQASLLLVNLTSHFIDDDERKLPDDVSWQRLIIVDTEMEVPLIGIAALITLLHRSNFMHEMAILFENFSAYPTLKFYVLPRRIYPCSNSSNSLTSFDFGMNRGSALPFHHTTTHVPQSCTLAGTRERSQLIYDSLPNSQRGATSSTAAAGVVTSALTTPVLVSSVCRLLKNLLIVAPDDTMICIQNERIVEHLVRILEETKRTIDENGLISTCSLSNIVELIYLLRDLMDLLTIACQTDPDLGMQLSHNKQILTILLSCLTTPCVVPRLQEELWHGVYGLLTFISLGIDEKGLSLLGACIIDKLNIIVDNLEVLLQPTSDPLTRLTALIWLTQTFGTFCKKSISGHLENVEENFSAILEIEVNKDCRTDQSEAGAKITTKLLVLHDGIMHDKESSGEEMIAVINALSTIVIYSQSAKNAAIAGGFIRRGLQRIRRIYSHISSPGENHALGFNFSKYREVAIKYVTGYFNLLENLMYQNQNAKIAALESELVQVVGMFWDLATNERTRMLPAVLSLLCTYIAHCPDAGKSLGYSVPFPILGQRGVSGTANLLDKVVNMCRQELTHRTRILNNQILDLCFTLLATSSFVHACRSVIIKSKLLQRFTIEGLRKLGKANSPEGITHLWLKLFVNLSFNNEGQEAILNVPDILEILLILTNKGNLSEKRGCMLILRNLCFLPSGKAKLLNSAEIINILTSCAVNDSQQIQELATSAIWELLANSQRAKTKFKSGDFLHRVQDAFELLRNKNDLSSSEEKSKEMLQLIVSSLENP